MTDLTILEFQNMISRKNFCDTKIMKFPHWVVRPLTKTQMKTVFFFSKIILDKFFLEEHFGLTNYSQKWTVTEIFYPIYVTGFSSQAK